MAASSVLVNAAFKYGASKAKADVPDLTALSKGQVDISKSYVKGVTDVFANMKKKRKALEATKNAQLRAFKETAAKARAHLLDEEQSQPMKVHNAIYDKFKSLEDEFKLYNTTGDNDNEQNEKMRANLYAQLQMITNQAVKSRGTIATAATMADDLLIKSMNTRDVDIATAIMGVDGNYDNIELSFDEKGQLLYHVGLADGSIHKWTIDDFNKNVHIHDIAIDSYSAKRELEQYKVGYNTSKTWNDKHKASEHKGFLTTVVGNDEKKLVDAMYSDLNGRKSWVDSLYDGEDSYNIANAAIEHLFEGDMMGKIGLVDVDGKGGITIADMDTDGVDGITEADLQNLTPLQKGYWEMNIEKIIGALTKLDNPGFNFERSSNALADYFVNGLEGHFNDGRGDKPPEKGKETDKYTGGIPWVTRTPTTGWERKVHANVQSVVDGQNTIVHRENNVEYTWTKEIGTQWGKPDVITYVSGKRRKTRDQMIKMLGQGNEAGAIPKDFNWDTIETEGTSRAQ